MVQTSAADAGPSEVRLDDGWTVVLFATQWCEPCVVAMDYLDGVVPGWALSGVRLIAAVSSDDAGEVWEFADQRSYRFGVVVDPAGSAGQAWQVRVTPFAFVIDPAGRVRAKGLVGGAKRVERFVGTVGRRLNRLGRAGTFVVWGALLGVGLLTVIPSSVVLLLPAAALAANSPVSGVIAGAAYGTGRAAVAVATSLRPGATPFSIIDSLERSQARWAKINAIGAPIAVIPIAAIALFDPVLTIWR